MKPLALVFNDAHIKEDNEQAILDAVIPIVEYASGNGIKDIIFAGDMFHSRSYQRQSILHTFDKILSLFYEIKCILHVIPGNHDKTLYSSYDSFLDIYRHHPCIRLYNDTTDVQINGKQFTFIPFFSDEMLIPKLANHKGGDVLISHFEMAGSTNLGRTSKKTSINKTLLNKWTKTYLGHYHNTHEISKNIVHLPSLIPDNFGEDNNKGFTVLYQDLSYKIIPGVFRRFIKKIIDIDKVGIAEIKKLIKNFSNNADSIRFEFIGTESKLKALDKKIFKDTGIDVKIKYTANYDFDDEDLATPVVINKYDREKIEQAFAQFCEEKEYDFKKGKQFLNEFLDKRNE